MEEKPECKEFSEKVSLYALGLISDYDRLALKKHSSRCKSCSAVLEQYLFLTDAVSKIAVTPEEAFEPDLDVCIAQVIRKKQTQQQFGKKRKYQILLVAALLTLAAVSLTLYKTIKKSDYMDYPVTISNDVFDKYTSVPIDTSRSISTIYAPVISGNIIFVVKSKDGLDQIAALHKETGVTLWTSSCACLGPIVLSDNSILAVCKNRRGIAQLVAFNIRSGKELWSIHPPGEFTEAFSLPLVNDHSIYWIASGILYNVNRTDGALKWKRSLPHKSGNTSPIVAAGSLCCGTRESVYCFNLLTGKLTNTIAMPEIMSGLSKPSIAALDNLVFVAHHRLNNAGILLCYDLMNKCMLWKKDSPYVYYLGVQAHQVLVRSQSVYALDPYTGDERWHYDAGGCSPISSDDKGCYVVTSGNTGKLIRIDPFSGTVLSMYSISGACTGLILNGTKGYITDNNGTLRVIELQQKPGVSNPENRSQHITLFKEALCFFN